MGLDQVTHALDDQVHQVEGLHDINRADMSWSESKGLPFEDITQLQGGAWSMTQQLLTGRLPTALHVPCSCVPVSDAHEI
jgi:hypothetical protein